MKLILQDNLWFRGAPHYANYRLNGEWMVPIVPRLGFTDSDDLAAKEQELKWLKKYTGRGGRRLVIAQEWIKPSGLIDGHLRKWWPTFLENNAPKARWCIFYDPVLAMRQRGVIGPIESVVDFGWPEVAQVWRNDLAYLAKHYFDHSRYWRLRGKPMLYVWAGYALTNTDREFAQARKSVYLLLDVLGATQKRPLEADGYTGFTAALPGMERRRHRLSDLLPDYEREYRKMQTLGNYDLIPAGSCQYDDWAFMLEKPLQILASSRDDVEEFLRLARSYAAPIEGTKYVFWGTMNNWAEGTSVLPTIREGKHFRSDRIGQYGFEHLRAVREVVRG